MFPRGEGEGGHQEELGGAEEDGGGGGGREGDVARRGAGEDQAQGHTGTETAGMLTTDVS